MGESILVDYLVHWGPGPSDGATSVRAESRSQDRANGGGQRDGGAVRVSRGESRPGDTPSHLPGLGSSRITGLRLHELYGRGPLLHDDGPLLRAAVLLGLLRVVSSRGVSEPLGGGGHVHRVLVLRFLVCRLLDTRKRYHLAAAGVPLRLSSRKCREGYDVFRIHRLEVRRLRQVRREDVLFLRRR